MKRNAYVLPVAYLMLMTFSACKTVRPVDSDPKFGAGEHMTLGNQGFMAACPKCPEIKNGITTAKHNVNLNYGQIVAFSGDFFASPTQLDEEATSGRLFFSNNVEGTKILFSQEVEEIKKQLADDSEEISDNNNQYIKNFKFQYLELAANNVSHFGWHNMKTYVFYHSQALQIALEGYRAKDVETKLKKRRLALLVNGFADHFLTDGFASGHVRIPRKQGIDWGRTNKSFLGQLGKDGASGGLAKTLHDNDHRYDSEKDVKGLRVKNSEGDEWLTRSDGDLFKGGGKDYLKTPHIRLPIEAVERSVQEVLEAFENGIEPKGVFAATLLVPFIHPKEQTLVETFPATMSDEELNKLMTSASYLWSLGSAIGLTTEVARKFYKDLPEIMTAFRNDVKADLANDKVVKADVINGIDAYSDPLGSELKKRLPKEYLQGYLNVQ